MNLTSQCSSGRYNAVWEGTGREPEPLPPGDFHQHLRAGWAWPSRLLPCLQLAGLGENGGLVTCKTGAVFWGSHTEYCGQRWRTEKKERERESTTGISHKEVQARGKHQRHPTAGPTPLCPGLPGGCAPRYQVLGGSATQWHTEADAWSVQTRGSFCAWPHSPLGQGSEDKR